jgi:hypothetical protein
VKVKRVQTPSSERSGQEFTMQVISGVHFAALAPHPSMKVMIPARVWNPSRHHFYPDSFRSACKEVLLCSNASTDQPFKPVRKESLNAASLLPRALWMEILSYTHRDCRYRSNSLRKQYHHYNTLIHWYCASHIWIMHFLCPRV